MASPVCPKKGSEEEGGSFIEAGESGMKGIASESSKKESLTL